MVGDTFNFDPASLIRPPFLLCPKCATETFGIVAIQGHVYFRRCRTCMFSQMFMLPPLRKKVIYLDQFALSNIMKALNPDTKAYKKGMDPFWLTLFEKLDRLCKLQLIACPDSDVHEKESRVSSHFTALNRINELLSGQVSFHNLESIRDHQVYQHVREWIKGSTLTDFDLDVRSVIQGDIEGWTDTIYPSFTMPWQPEWVENLRKSRGELHQKISDVYSRWQSEGGNQFKYWFEEEIKSYGVGILKEVNKYHIKLKEVLSNKREAQLADFVVWPAVRTYLIVRQQLIASGFKEKELADKTIEYFTSPSLHTLLFLRISSMIWASVARKAASGMKKLPSQGLSNDVDAISTLLPYCDAMFIDNECRAYFCEGPLRSELKYGTVLFSLKIKEEFLGFLDSIESSMSRAHLQLINEIYGDDWAEPFMTVFTKE